MRHLKKLAVCLAIFLTINANTQEKKNNFSIGGKMGISYEGYTLNKTPDSSTPDFYAARRPGSLFRFSFNPIFTIGDWSIPVNFNFSPSLNNFTTPSITNQSVWQFLSNPANNFGINPKNGNTEFLLGTQNLKYSDLSTGNLGIFGYGIDLSPGIFRIKFFSGISQSPVNYVASNPPNQPGVIGAYQRNQWMAQFGLEKEEKYFIGFNFVKSKDKLSSVSSPPLSPIDPQENMVVSFLATAKSENGWKYHIELGQSFHTRNLNTPLSSIIVDDFKPFINSHTSTTRDNAVIIGISKKAKDWEIGSKLKYYGAGYFTAGYPFMNNDLVDYLINTRFNTWKKKINVKASIGKRFGNLSRNAGPEKTRQIKANINVYTQFNDNFSLNTNFNNFGYYIPGSTGYRSVNNELSINPMYTWYNDKMSHLISLIYTHSKYDETILTIKTHNNTQTALLLYVPTFFNKNINPDFSIMWFRNTAPSIKLTLFTATSGITWNVNPTFKLKGQLQYNLSTLSPFTANKNLLVSSSFDWEIYKKLSWQFSLTVNAFRFGTELPGNSLIPIYSGKPSYFETTLRTGLLYKF